MPTPPKYREVINGRMVTVATRRGDGRIYVEARVYAGPTMTGEPISDWELPHTFRYDLAAAAQLAYNQTPKEST